MKANWQYLLIVFILAALVAGGTFWFSERVNELPAIVNLPGSSGLNKFAGEAAEEKNSPEENADEPEDLSLTFTQLRLARAIEEGKEFLLRMADEEKQGFHKYYYAPEDRFEERLHTVYSASIIYTLLKVYDFAGDERILGKIPEWGEFLLSMQDKNKENKSYGAFHYSLYLSPEEKEERFVVGTAALSIFTLLDLYERFPEEKYLMSAELAGDWLLTMQEENGIMRPYLRHSEGKWLHGTKESLLYNGQVLAALSRLYQASQKEKYFAAAEKIAKHFAEKAEKEGCFLGDEYRSPNPISSAWVAMALLDFYKVSPEEKYREIILNCSRELAKRQITENTDPLYYGRWTLAFSTSGNGWLAEVMTEIYHFCQNEGAAGCANYKTAVINVIQWLMQFTYSGENSADLPNSQRATGGIFWDYNDKYVRTDSVCHALNAYLGIIDDLGK